MKDLFPGHYLNTEEQKKQAWKDCLFVFDANVLLNLYRYSETTKLELFKVLEELIDQIWIPHQVALEFQRNRLLVIAEQIGRFSDVSNLINKTKANFEQEISKRKLEKRHSSIDPEQFLEKLDSVYSQFSAELSDLKSRQIDVEDDDEVRDTLDELLNGKVGKPPESQDWLDNIYKEGKIRYAYECPPGFEDANKSTQNVNKSSGFFHNGLRYERKFGDLIFWKQLIEKASSEEIKKVILVTDDQKEDWWWIVRGKTIGPRPELTEEIIQEAGVETFIMYTAERFLLFASEYLGLEIPEKSIEQVRDVAEQSGSEILTDQSKIVEMDEDVGYLDLIDSYLEGFAEGQETLNLITVLVKDIGSKMNFHTSALNQLKETSGTVSTKDAKRIINDVARDLSDFADQLEERTAGFSELFEESINMLPLAATQLEIEERQKLITKMLPPLDKLLQNVNSAISAYIGMRDSIANLPRLTGNLNRAKRRGISASELFINALNEIKQSIEGTINNLNGQIGNS